MKHLKRSLLCVLLVCAVLALQACPVTAQIISADIKSAEEYSLYGTYASDIQENTLGTTVTLTAENISETSGTVEQCENYENMDGVSLKTGEDSRLTWQTDSVAGWYTVRATYYPEDCRSNYAQRKILINGSVPFDEAADIYFYSTYIDENGIMTDYYGNDIRSAQVRKSVWRTVSLYDRIQYFTEPLTFYLPENAIFTVEAISESLTLRSIELIPYKPLDTYEDVLSAYKQQGYDTVKNHYEIYEAEKPDYKTDPTVLPSTDSSASTSPHDNYRVKLNKISGGNWKTSGQLLTWTVTVPQDGLYYITLKAKQSTDRGSYSTRRIYINGEVPFAEANGVKFTYSKKWENITLGGEEPWCFFLHEGENEISIETTLGDMGAVLEEASDILDQFNTIYRDLLVVLGSSPDQYRDYKLDSLLPDTIANIKVQKDRLAAVLDEIYDITGQKGNNLSVFSTILNQLEDFCRDSDKIPAGFDYFKTNIGSLGTWITTAMEQPLDLDYIIVSGSETELPNPEAGFFKKLINSLISFIASFIVDYDSIGNMSESTGDPIVVWMTSGRDQMQVLKVLIQNSFVKETGIGVQLENVEATAVLKAVAAHNGPDVLLGVQVSEPINFALRNAAYDLNRFEDISQLTERFNEETLVPFSFNGGLYALPETISFKVMFYRSDILNDLGLSVPETWDDVIEVASILQKNNMTFGLPITDVIGTYATFMYQKNAELYVKDGSKCLLTDEANTEAFEIMADFFKNYSLELSYNFVNRFRIGEMPIAIDVIAGYNNLKVSAPEIDGLWGMALLPGTPQEDGSINRTGYVSATGSMILNDSDKPDDAYKFLKWWTDADTQRDFGTEIESILGPSSRYLTANMEAFGQLPWTDSELAVLNEQLKISRAVPEVPGSYYISRHLNNAFRAVVISHKDLRDTLATYTETINDELTSKRKEFGLN